MDLNSFFENFEVISNAPGGVARLRELIIDLAMHGKLTKGQKSELDLSKIYSAPGISMGIPSHWGILNFENGFDLRGGGQPPKSTFIDVPRDGYIRLYQIRDYGPNPVPVYVPRKLAPRTTQEGDILIARYGASGKVFWAEDGAYNVALAKLLYPKDLYLPNFAFLMFKSGGFQRAVRGTTRVAVDGFNKKDLRNVYFPLPPLEEQQVIVDRVNHYMRLCDELEVKKTIREKVRNRARASAFDAVSAATTSDELSKAWARIIDNWLAFADSAESVESLRALVLKLGTKYCFDRDLISGRQMKLREICNVSWGNLSLTKSSFVSDGQYLAVSAAGADGRIGHSEHKAFTPVLSAIGARCGMVFMPNEAFTAIKNTMTLTPMTEIIDNWFLYYSIMSVDLPRRGSAQPFLSKQDIEEFVIFVPTLEAQNRAVLKIAEMLELCDELESGLKIRSAYSARFSDAIISKLTEVESN